MPTFWEIAAHSVDSVNHMFSLYFDHYLILVISRFGLECWSWVLIASVPALCILFTFKATCGGNRLETSNIETREIILSKQENE